MQTRPNNPGSISRSGSLALALASLCLLHGKGAVPADTPSDLPLPSKIREIERVRLVLLPATVTDRHGRAVAGLTTSDFRLFENSVPQEVRYVTPESDNAISIAFLLDLSGSMRQVGKLDAAKDAIRHLVEALAPEDRFALIGFADQQVGWITDFTTDRTRFLSRLAVQEGYGPTALYDAVAATPGLVDRTTEGRKAIVLITDGVDNASRQNSLRARQLARRVDVPIYSIAFSSLARPELAGAAGEMIERVLEQFSEDTGGRLFMIYDPDALKEAATQIEEALRGGYLLGYYPTHTAWDGGFRTLHLEVARRGMKVRTRSGYYATP